MFRYLPEQGSEVAPEVDALNHLITDLSVFFTVAIVGAMLFFAIKYRRRNGVDHETPRIEGSNLLEVVWTVVPTVICIYLAIMGVVVYRDMVAPGKDEITIQVRGQMWKWDFEYDNGKKTTSEFVVPVGKRIRLVMKSRDVLHSFFIPVMRVKKDVLPNKYTYIRFTPVKTGEYHSFCTEYCGKDHSGMLAMLRVVSEDEYDQWVSDRSDELLKASLDPAELGKELYTEKGCNACHSLDGSQIVGPSFLNVYERKGEFVDGTAYVADENYIRKSILNPNAEIVKGYVPNLMPAFEGQLNDDEIDAIISFMKTVDGSTPVEEEVAVEEDQEEKIDLTKLSAAERGEYVYKNNLCITCHSLDGSGVVGPTFKGLYGKKGKLNDGSSYAANDEYIKRSIYKPQEQIVEGYPPAMPSFEGKLTEEQVSDLIEFIKTTK